MILDDLNLHDGDIRLAVDASTILLTAQHHFICDGKRCESAPVTLTFFGVSDLLFKEPVYDHVLEDDGHTHLRTSYIENAKPEDYEAHMHSWLEMIESENPSEAKAWRENVRAWAMKITTQQAFLDRLEQTRAPDNGMSRGVADAYTPENDNYVQLDMHCDWRVQFRYASAIIKLPDTFTLNTP